MFKIIEQLYWTYMNMTKIQTGLLWQIRYEQKILGSGLTLIVRDKNHFVEHTFLLNGILYDVSGICYYLF